MCFNDKLSAFQLAIFPHMCCGIVERQLEAQSHGAGGVSKDMHLDCWTCTLTHGSKERSPFNWLGGGYTLVAEVPRVLLQCCLTWLPGMTSQNMCCNSRR